MPTLESFGVERLPKLRYWCFRIQKRLVDKDNAPPYGNDPDYPKGLKQKVEALDGFDGWEHFAMGAPKGWDLQPTPKPDDFRLAPEEEVRVYTRDISKEAAWEAALSRTVRPLPAPE